MNMYEKIAGIKYERQRRFIRWTADGQLEPGQRMVIDYMLPKLLMKIQWLSQSY